MANDPHAPETAPEGAIQPAPKRSPAATALTVVFFLILIFIGIAIAIYSSRYVPMAVNTFSSTNPVTGLPNNAQLAVTPGTTIPFNNSQTVATTTVMTPSAVSEPQATNVRTETGTSASASTGFPTTGPMYSTLPSGYQSSTPSYQQSAPTYQTASAYNAPVAYGLPDLDTNIVAVGYLANSSNSSFIAAPVIPVGARAAVEFTIGNDGTAPTGPWTFTAEIPTDNGYTFNSPIEASMNPGDHVFFTLAFDQVPTGPAEMIEIIADPNNVIQELTKTNNTAGASVSVVGS